MSNAARRARWPSLRGALLALVVICAALALQPPPLPLDAQSADSWIYATMAEEPAVFTARPWGYRILAAWLAHALGGARRFPYVTLAALALTGVALYLYLRQLGFRDGAALLGVAGFGLSGPVALSTVNPYLCEPVTVLAETAFLFAVASGAGRGLLALLGVVAALSKEIQLVLLPLVYFARRRQEGYGRALAAAALVALPALTATVLMRAFWTPHLGAMYAVPRLDTLAAAVERLSERWQETGVLLAGLTPLAALGALRKKARPYLATYGYLTLALLVLPYFAWVYDARPGREPFFGGSVRRLLIYAVPVLIPLALMALDRALPLIDPGPRGAPPRRPLLGAASALAALVLATSPLWGMDRYRRAEIRGPITGEAIRAICRESLKAAARLEGGQRVTLDPDAHRFSEENPRLARARWFLHEGWGGFPYFETGDAVMEREAASLLVPCFRPVELELRLTLSAPREMPLLVEINGLALGAYMVTPEARELRLRVPAAALFRGDNLLGLAAIAAEPPRARFLGLVLEPTRGPATSTGG